MPIDREERKPFNRNPAETAPRKAGLSRRDLLKNAAGAALAAAGASLTGAFDARGQVQGSMPGGGSVPLRLPIGAMEYLDRKEYIHNMEIHAHLSGVTASGGEPLTTMWAKGAQRLLPGGGGFVDISDGRKPVALYRRVYQGGLGCVAYNANLKKWIMMNSAASPLTAPNPQYPHGQYDKEYRDKSTSYTGLRGIRTYD